MTIQERLKQEEYGFGPWLVEITSEDLIPVQYLDYTSDIMNGTFAVKVPVDIDRKDVKLGMILYKNVLIFSEETLVLLQCQLKAVKKTVIQFKDMVYFTRGGELLCNYIEFGTRKEKYRIDYYTVSEDIISRILIAIRQSFHLGDGVLKTKRTDKTLTDLPIYQYFLKKERMKEKIEIVDYQKSFYVPKNISINNRLYKIPFLKHKHEDILFMANQYELVIASDDLDKKRSSTVNYSYRHVYINKSQISRVFINKEKKMKYLQIEMSQTKLKFPVDQKFRTDNIKYAIK